MPKYYSPLRYPGGKASLLLFLSRIVAYNGPIDTYIEPFAGGAGAALGLLLNGNVDRIILNDADEFIYSFWYTILNHKKRLIREIKNTPITIDQYRLHKNILSNVASNSSSKFELGFTAFFLNRCNRSGILKSGPIGGYEQHGQWKINARFNKDDLIDRIEKIYLKKEQILIYNQDALQFLKLTLPKLNLDFLKSLIYLDPPYYIQGPELYRTFYHKDQHIQLKDFLTEELKTKWILSYDDVDYINELYNGTRINGINKNHFAYKARVGKELIIISDNCFIPNENE